MAVGAHDKKVDAVVGEAVLDGSLRRNSGDLFLRGDGDIDTVAGKRCGEFGAGETRRLRFAFGLVDREDFDAIGGFEKGQGIEGGAGCLARAVPGDQDPFDRFGNRQHMRNEENGTTAFVEETVDIRAAV